MSRPLLSATLIARNEKRNVARCLDSIWQHVDEVCVGDTGSTDGTIAEFRRYAKRRGQPAKLKIKRVKWADDFAAARQAVDEIATGQWLIWLDLDDTITGADRLRQYAADAGEEVVAFFCRYAYARDADGNTISELWRERVVRNNGTRWEGRLHEHKLFTQGAIVKVDPEVADWVHRRDHTHRTGERNLRILKKWDRADPDSPRVVQSLAMEYMGEERHQEASDVFARYLALPGEPPDRRAQAFRHLGVMLMLQDRVGEARATALDALAETWLWADTHLTLAEAEQTLGRPDVALTHAQTALMIGKPDTLLIVNPLQYTAHPRAVMAVCLGQMGRFEEAVQACEEALQIAPSYPFAVQQLPVLRGQLKKQHAVVAVLAMADVLVEAGELVKAHVLLGQAPWYVADDERIVRRRGELFAALRHRRTSPEDQVEDLAADQFIQRHTKAAA